MKKNIQEYLTYLSPEFIYIPYDKVENLRIKKNKIVFNNMFMGKKDDEHDIYSPVSGYVMGIKEIELLSGPSNSLVIENDFIDKRENLNTFTEISNIKKTDIKGLLFKYGLEKKTKGKTTLIVESTYNKHNDLGDMVINYEYYEEILEAIDELITIFNMKNAYIILDKNDLYSEAAFNKYINAFHNICIIHNKKRFHDDKCAFYTIEDILAVYRAIHLDYMLDTTIVTINYGETIIVKVKLFTSLYELLKALKVPYKGKEITINNKIITNVENFIINKEVKSIIIK